jgi:hypothetical protein
VKQDVSLSSPVALLCSLSLVAICAGCGEQPKAPPEPRLVNVA